MKNNFENNLDVIKNLDSFKNEDKSPLLFLQII